MRSTPRKLKLACLVIALGTALALTPMPQTHAAFAADRYSQESRRGFNDEYVFATTRGVNDMDGVHPALKLTLFPVTIVLDTVFLPFAVIAGFIA